MTRLIPSVAGALILALAPVSAAKAQEPTNPVGFTLSCTIPSGGLTCTAQIALPAGKRIVLEHVSARAHAPSGHTVQMHVSTSSPNLPDGTTALRHFIAFTPAANGRFYFASHPLRMYGTTGSYVSIHGQRISYPVGASGAVEYQVYFSGYLLP